MRNQNLFIHRQVYNIYLGKKATFNLQQKNSKCVHVYYCFFCFFGFCFYYRNIQRFSQNINSVIHGLRMALKSSWNSRSFARKHTHSPDTMRLITYGFCFFFFHWKHWIEFTQRNQCNIQHASRIQCTWLWLPYSLRSFWLDFSKCCYYCCCFLAYYIFRLVCASLRLNMLMMMMLLLLWVCYIFVESYIYIWLFSLFHFSSHARRSSFISFYCSLFLRYI